MDIDKLTHKTVDAVEAGSFSSLMDIDKLTRVPNTGQTFDGFSSLMDIDKLTLSRQAHLPL